MSSRNPRRRSRIAHFKAPFIVSVAAPAAFGLACGGKAGDPDVGSHNPPAIGGSSGYVPPAKVPPTGGSGGAASTRPCSGDPPTPPDSFCGAYACVDGEWKAQPVGCNPPPILPPPACPATEPAIGTACPQFGGGMTCDYEYCGGVVPTRHCSYGTGLWEPLPVQSCNPPECPTSMPVVGSDCDAEGQECLYPVCPPTPSSATCRYGQWAVVYSPGAACNPPAVVPVCPQRAIVEGASCWYEEQLCGTGPCVGDTQNGLQCVGGHWQGEALFCTPAEAPDGGI